MNIRPVAVFHSPFPSKFGIPRQSGLVEELEGTIVFEPDYRDPVALRGIDAFDFLWLIWGFSANSHDSERLTVRPPRLGGNTRMGVFATRSPFRPNRMGLSSVRLKSVEWDTPQGPVLHVLGADLMDGTPVYDVKPYIPYTDSHENARSGFVDDHEWKKLHVVVPDEVARIFTPEMLQSLIHTLEQDPRPQYHNHPDKLYGMVFAGHDIHFRVSDDTLYVMHNT
jgi:tRNA-Thr(GGU) m(6)t(6)A37 methyltransferase TsaA